MPRELVLVLPLPVTYRLHPEVDPLVTLPLHPRQAQAFAPPDLLLELSELRVVLHQPAVLPVALQEHARRELVGLYRPVVLRPGPTLAVVRREQHPPEQVEPCYRIVLGLYPVR